MRRLRLAVPLAIIGLLIAAAPGFAATRYASSSGATGTGACGSAVSGAGACTLKWAIEGAGANDTVIVQPDGTYNVNSTIVLNGVNGVTIQPPAAARASIQVNNVLGLTVSVPATIRNLDFSGSPPASGCFCMLNIGGTGTLVERVSARTSSPSHTFASGPGVTVRDSYFYMGDPTPGSYADALVASGTVINVTAISDSANGPGIIVSDSFDTTGATLRLSNSIARGHTYDMVISNQAPSNPDVSMTVDHSNFRGSTVFGFINDAGGNQLGGGAQLVNGAGAADVHQLPGSPTIDAGAANSSLGTLDFDGQSRILGPSPDIGADEFVPSASVVSDTTKPVIPKPVISRLKAVKKKGKLKSFTFTSSAAGTATFEFTRKKGKKYKSAGSQRKAVKAGKNSIKPKKLKKGKYRLTLTVKDAAGNSSIAKRLSFKIK